MKFRDAGLGEVDSGDAHGELEAEQGTWFSAHGWMNPEIGVEYDTRYCDGSAAEALLGSNPRASSACNSSTGAPSSAAMTITDRP